MLALVFTFGVLAPSARACPQDWNTSGTLDADDLFAFIDDWFLGVADFNRDRLTDADDLFAYMDAYFAGCENGSDNGLTGMYLQPEVEGGVAALAGVLGVRTYLSDIILLTPGAGTELEIRLLNSYTQGIDRRRVARDCHPDRGRDGPITHGRERVSRDDGCWDGLPRRGGCRGLLDLQSRD
jgi:hypothetical protein